MNEPGDYAYLYNVKWQWDKPQQPTITGKSGIDDYYSIVDEYGKPFERPKQQWGFK